MDAFYYSLAIYPWFPQVNCGANKCFFRVLGGFLPQLLADCRLKAVGENLPFLAIDQPAFLQCQQQSIK